MSEPSISARPSAGPLGRPPAHSARYRLGRVSIAASVVLALVALGVWVLRPGPRTITITAEFSEAPGLFVGNHVEVLGIPVGRVTSVRASPSGVSVRMAVTTGQPIPAGAQAILMAPDVVNDRFVQLSPAYRRGPKLRDGAVIPTARTGIPVSVDQVFDTLDQLAKALGPHGANAHGALSTLIARLAKALGGNGSNLHQAVVEASQALAGVSSNPKQLTTLLDNLGRLTQAAAKNTDSYDSFALDLSSVSSSLASDNGDIARALSDLQALFANLTTFVRDNQSSLHGSVANLATFATRLAKEQKSLAVAFDVGPLALQNLDAAVDPAAPGGTALRGRYDPTGAGAPLVSQVCGNTLLRGLTVATNPTQRTELDVDCLFARSLDALPAAPGAPAGPNLGLSALLGSR
jgi:phospholipid/cholesterol/gamma-HCH transport system substrate-binding protein